MNRKDFFKELIYMYFIIVTLIDVAIFIIGSIFRPNELFGYEAFASPLIYGLISLIPSALFLNRKERTLTQEIIKDIVQIVLLEVLLVMFGFGVKSFTNENRSIILGFIFSVFVIYVLVKMIIFFLDTKSARQMTEDLKLFQERA